MRVYLIGFMGCGKTHWGRLLSEKLSIPFFDLDEQIVSNENKSINAIFDEEGEEYFRMKEKETLHMLSVGHETFIMACGGGTPCYYNNIDYMKKAGTVVWLNSSMEKLFERLLKEKDHRPLIRDLSNDQLKSYILKKFSDRRIFFQQASVIINEEDINLDFLVRSILHS